MMMRYIFTVNRVVALFALLSVLRVVVVAQSTNRFPFIYVRDSVSLSATATADLKTKLVGTGVANTGSTTLGADTDVNGVGEIALQTRNITRLLIDNGGNMKFYDALGTFGNDSNSVTVNKYSIVVNDHYNHIANPAASYFGFTRGGNPKSQFNFGLDVANTIYPYFAMWAGAGYSNPEFTSDILAISPRRTAGSISMTWGTSVGIDTTGTGAFHFQASGVNKWGMLIDPNRTKDSTSGIWIRIRNNEYPWNHGLRLHQLATDKSFLPLLIGDDFRGDKWALAYGWGGSQEPFLSIAYWPDQVEIVRFDSTRLSTFFYPVQFNHSVTFSDSNSNLAVAGAGDSVTVNRIGLTVNAQIQLTYTGSAAPTIRERYQAYANKFTIYADAGRTLSFFITKK